VDSYFPIHCKYYDICSLTPLYVITEHEEVYHMQHANCCKDVASAKPEILSALEYSNQVHASRLGVQATCPCTTFGGVGGRAGHWRPGDDPRARVILFGQAEGCDD